MNIHPLSLLGAALEILGIVLGLIGFFGVARKAGQYPWTGVVRTATAGADRARDRIELTIDRVTRRRKAVVVAPDPLSLKLTVFPPTVRTGFAPLRGHGHGAKLQELAARTDELRTKIEETADRLNTKDQELEALLETVGTRLDEEVARIERERRAEDLGDSRLQFLGLLLVVVGIVVSTVGQMLNP